MLPLSVPLRIVLYALLAWNALVLIVYGADKYAAGKGRRRVPERTLILMAVLLGAPGALVGMYLFRHKTQKPKFSIGVPLILVAQAVLTYLAVRALGAL